MCRWCVYVGKSVQLEQNPDPSQTFMIPKAMLEDTDGSFMSIIDRDSFDYVYSEVRSFLPTPIAPLKTTGDGNCLLHAVSRSIWGIESYHEMLRKKLLQELSENIEWYKKSAPGDDIVEADWDKAIQMASKSGQHLEFIHFFALTHVIKRPIILYASDDDMRDYGQGELGVCATFVPVRIPVEEVKAPPVYLTWSSKFKAHFIPLVGHEDQPFPHLPLLHVAFAKNFGTQEQLLKYVKPEAPVVAPPAVAQMNAATDKEQPSMLEGLMAALQSYQKKSEMSAFARMMEKSREKKAKKAGELCLVTLPNGQQMLLNRQPGQRYMWDADSERLVLVEGVDEEMFEKAEKARREADRVNKTEFEGKYYDFVFDISFAPDQPPKKLPYNKGDNPSLAAFEFLTRNGIQPNTQKVDKIATHITRAIQSKKKPVASPSAILDSKPPPTNYKHLPHHPKRANPSFPRYVLFPTGNKRMVSKLQELSEKLPDGHKNLSLCPAEILILERTMTLLQSVEDPTTLDANSLQDDVFPLMDKLLKWPPQSVFPAIDFCRLLILHPKAATHYTRSPDILKQLITTSKSTDEVIRMLSLRFVANMFARDATTRLLLDNRKPVILLLQESFKSPKLRSTVIAVINNFATHSPSLDPEGRLVLSALAVEMLKASPSNDEEVNTYSTILSLGTLMYYDDTVLAAVMSDTSWSLPFEVHRKNPSSTDRIKAVCEEFMDILQKRSI